jgi:acetyl-CoA acetyltransferase
MDFSLIGGPRPHSHQASSTPRSCHCVLPSYPTPKTPRVIDWMWLSARTTLEQMAAARSAFKGSGDERSTGPNSSQVTDGAAMVLLMRRRRAEELGLEVLAKHVGTSVVGVTPRVMGVGPVEAIP